MPTQCPLALRVYDSPLTVCVASSRDSNFQVGREPIFLVHLQHLSLGMNDQPVASDQLNEDDPDGSFYKL